MIVVACALVLIAALQWARDGDDLERCARCDRVFLDGEARVAVEELATEGWRVRAVHADVATCHDGSDTDRGEG